jgi:hypothetical protein
LAHAKGAVPSRLRPLGATNVAIVATGAGLRGCLRGRGEERKYLIGGPRGYFGRSSHPAGEVGFERELVDVAVVVGLASDFVPVGVKSVSESANEITISAHIHNSTIVEKDHVLLEQATHTSAPFRLGISGSLSTSQYVAFVAT